MEPETRYLLACLAEECAEVTQRVMKALRFGLNETQPGQEFDNLDRLYVELVDLIAMLELLNERCVLKEAPADYAEAIALKKAKVLKYMEYARSVGALT